MKLHTKLILEPCGCEALAFVPEVTRLVARMAGMQHSTTTIMVEVEEQMHRGYWFRVPNVSGWIRD